MKEALGNKIRDERIRQGLTQAQVAFDAGFTRRQTILQIEKGMGNSLDHLISVCEVLGIELVLNMPQNKIPADPPPSFDFSKVDPSEPYIPVKGLKKASKSILDFRAIPSAEVGDKFSKKIPLKRNRLK